MSFGDGLQHILNRVPGALGVAIAGMDGIIVEERKNDPRLDLQALGAECSTLLKSADRTTSSIEASGLKEFSMVCDNYVFVLRRINNDYFLILALPSEREFGKGRFQLRRAVTGLIKEMA